MMANLPWPCPSTIGQRKVAAPVREVTKRKNLTYGQKLEIMEMSGVGKKFEINESTVQGNYPNCEHIKSHMKLAKSDAGA